jgi:hypothetical protein
MHNIVEIENRCIIQIKKFQQNESKPQTKKKLIYFCVHYKFLFPN